MTGHEGPVALGLLIIVLPAILAFGMWLGRVGK